MKKLLSDLLSSAFSSKNDISAVNNDNLSLGCNETLSFGFNNTHSLGFNETLSFDFNAHFSFVCNEDSNPTISSLVFDSRHVKEGSLYFSWPGVHVHGNTYIAKAIEAGASAVIFQDELPEEALKIANEKKVPLIKVNDSRIAMSPVASAFYDNPSSKMIIIGVTGTEGKSTTVFLIWQMLRLCGKKAGFFSTVQCSLGGDAINNPEHQTTPEATVVQEKLYNMVANGCEYAVVESSSHGLSKRTNRLGDVAFDVSVMMNVTHEHLEFHGTHEQYKSDKANLFRALDIFSHTKTVLGTKRTIKPFGVVNVEDASAEYFANATKSPVFGFTTYGKAGAGNNTNLCGTDNCCVNACHTSEKQSKTPFIKTVAGTNIISDSKGVDFVIEQVLADEHFTSSSTENSFTNAANKQECIVDTCSKSSESDATVITTKTPIHINVPGAFNVYNTLATLIVVGNLLNKTPEELKEAATKLIPVKGRMTVINKGQPFEVIVDYAHTPSSFNTIFPPICQRAKGKVFALFGSGGERDTKKRPEQGRIASTFCDVVFLTDEDPRGENPMELLEMIAAGSETVTNVVRDKNLFLIPDRPTAIRKAFSMAKQDDIILLLGKAHENSIMYKGYDMPYDEISEAEKALSEMGYK